MKGWKKGFLALLAVLAFAGVAVADETPYLEYQQNIRSALTDGKATYGEARFHTFYCYIELDRDPTEAEKALVGTFTFKGATFGWVNDKGVTGNVAGTDKSFELRNAWVGPQEIDFEPYAEGGFVTFTGVAETGLPGKTVEWSIPTLQNTTSEAFPQFSTLAEQKSAFVPYVELVTDAAGYVTGIQYRFVLPSDPTKAVSVPARGNLRVRLYTKANPNSYAYKSDRVDFTAGSTPEGTIQIPADKKIKVSDLGAVSLRRSDASFGAANGSYDWKFEVSSPATSTPVPSHTGGGSGGGCSAFGFVPLALLLLAPLGLLRKRG